MQLRRLVIEDGAVVHEEVLLKDEIGRIRDVRQGPDGNLWILTDAARGSLIRIEPNGR
jgi:glucose/arabinose dehydrogenase